MVRKQFNVTLDAELIRRIKYASIDAQLSLSDLVGRVLANHVAPEDTMTDLTPRPDPVPALTLQPMIHVQNMAEAVAFYQRLGGRLRHGSRDGDWVAMTVGGAEISLLAHPPNPEQHEGIVELNFEYASDLEQLENTLTAAGVQIAAPTTDEGFGRQLQVRAPDGLLIKINELDPTLYG